MRSTPVPLSVIQSIQTPSAGENAPAAQIRLKARRPTGNPLLHTYVDSSVVTALAGVTGDTLHEMDFPRLRELYDRGQTTFKLPFNFSVAPKLSRRNLMPGSYEIRSGDGIRRQCDERYKKQGQDITWVETKATVDVTEKGAGEFSLGCCTPMAAKMGLTGTVSYRQLEPYANHSGEIDLLEAAVNSCMAPITAERALKSPHGTEIEVTVKTQLQLGADMEYAAVNVSLADTVEGNLSYFVQRLPNASEVLVKITKGGVNVAGLGVNGKMTKKLNEHWYDKIPSSVRGALGYVFNFFRLTAIPRLIDQVTDWTIDLFARHTKKRKQVARFVFDLSKPQARQAFNRIFLGVGVHAASELAQMENSGVRHFRMGEKSSLRELGARLDVNDTDVLGYNSISEDRDGQVVGVADNDVVFRESKYERDFHIWFRGKKNIKWETIVVKRASDKPLEYAYHFSFFQQNYIATESDIQTMLSFARSLGLSVENTSFIGLPMLQNEIEFHTDLFFTDAGVKRISQVGYDEALNAYLKTAKFFDKDGQELPILDLDGSTEAKAVFERYDQLAKGGWISRMWHRKEIQQLKERYKGLTQGRSLSGDWDIWVEGHDFAKKMAAFNLDGQSSAVESFFRQLGKSAGFGGMKTIAAMVAIATQKETLIHELSLKGSGVQLTSSDEGEIVSPEVQMTRMIARIG